jgi:HD-GYP domain-containing protein (c-di-GMP phosphodiesterase class II)
LENGDKSGLTRIVLDLINVLVAVMEEKDAAFKGHAERVASYCVQVARRMGLEKKQIESIYPAALLHDIGLVYIPTEIINRPNALSENEQSLYEKHPMIGEKILSNVGIFSKILPAIRHHHENLDGSGYPYRLRGDEISIEARIMRVVDQFDTLTSPSPGRQIVGIQEALAHLSDGKGTLYDPQVVGVFSNLVQSTFSREQATEQGSSTIKKVLDKIVAKFKRGEVQLPVLPAIVHKIKEALDSQFSSADDISKVLELDAVVSIRIISVANSIAYRGREKILTVRQAVPRLGTRETQSIVLAIVNKNLYETKESQFRVLMEQLWKHALATAYCARRVAERLSLSDLEKFFTLGLIHDIGKIPILQAITKLKNEGDPSLQDMDFTVITGILKDAHARFGGALLAGWDFDKGAIHIVQAHEDPTLDEQSEKVLMVVHLANLMTRKIGLSQYNEEDLVLGELSVAKLLGLSDEDLNTIAEDVRKTVHESSSNF